MIKLKRSLILLLSSILCSAGNGSTGCLEVLLFYDGIKINLGNKTENDTALHKAAGYKDPEIAYEMAQTLVTKGASARSKSFLAITLN